MLKYYEILKKVPTLSANLSWSHYDEILKLKDIKEIIYYIKLIETYNLSVRELRSRIKNQEYERLLNDTKNKLLLNEENKIEDFVKNPIVI